jgi:hypothetical protein
MPHDSPIDPALCVFLALSALQLDLRGNGLTNDGAIIISRGLRSAESKKLAELDMGYNEIKDDGACALAQVRMVRRITAFCMCVARSAAGIGASGNSLRSRIAVCDGTCALAQVCDVVHSGCGMCVACCSALLDMGRQRNQGRRRMRTGTGRLWWTVALLCVTAHAHWNRCGAVHTT